MSSSRLVKHVYVESRKRYEAGKSSKWCKYTHELLKELGMNDVWQQGTITCNMATWDKELREDTCTRRKGMACKDANKTQTTHIPHNQTQTRI